jgi:hypothetical protein
MSFLNPIPSPGQGGLFNFIMEEHDHVRSTQVFIELDGSTTKIKPCGGKILAR